MKSVSDTIQEGADVTPVRNDWLHLISPLSSAMTRSVASAPDDLYIEQTDNRGELPVTYFGQGVIDDLPNDWPGRFNSLMQTHGRPLVLLGDPGVGKSAWISRFISHLGDIDSVSEIRYDQHQHDGWPVASNLSEEERVTGHLVTDLVTGLKRDLQRYGKTGDALFSHDEEIILQDPARNITKRFWDTVAAAIQTLNIICGHTCFFFIDNLDLYASAIQKRGIAFGCHIAMWAGIRVVISLRPATYDALGPAGIELKNPRVYTVNPIPVGEMIKKRLAYVWNSPDGDAQVQGVLSTLRNITLDLRWAKNQTDLPAKLRRVHERVVNLLTENRTFEEAIQDLHNFNLREILEIIKQLLESGFFSESILDAMDGSTRTSPEDLITAYLRGPYRHYRSRTVQYRVRPINVLDIRGVPESRMLVGVRALQWLSKWPSSFEGARSIEMWRDALTQFGYPLKEVDHAIIHLAQTEMVFDVKRQENWSRLADPLLVDEDRFVLAPAGRFVLDRLLGKYAFRYADAVADVIRIPRPGGGPWAANKDRESMIRNVLGVVELVQNAAECEVKMLEETARMNGMEYADLHKQFSEEFASSEVAGGEFLVPFTKECCGRAKALQRAQENATSFIACRQLIKYLDDTIPRLMPRATALSKGSI